MKLNPLLIPLCTALLLTGCGGVDPDSPLGKRKAVFKEILRVSEELRGMSNGRIPYDGRRFDEQAGRLETLAQEPWQYFPETRDDRRSQATEAVWQRQERFQSLARELETASQALRETTGLAEDQRQPAQTSAIERIEATCRTCHKEFRTF